MTYPDVTQTLVSESLEALQKVLDGKGSKLTSRERSTLKVLSSHAATLRQTYDSIEYLSADPLAKAVLLTRQLQAYEHDAQRLRERRNAAVHDALEDGISAYRVAKALGLSEQAVYKIRDRDRS